MTDLAVDIQYHGIAYLQIIGIGKPLDTIDVIILREHLDSGLVKACQEVFTGRLVDPKDYYIAGSDTHWNPMRLGLVINSDEGWFLMTFVR